MMVLDERVKMLEEYTRYVLVELKRVNEEIVLLKKQFGLVK